MKKLLFLTLLGVVLLGGMTFAGGQQEAEEDGPEIAVLVKIEGIPWFDRMQVGIEEAAEELGVNAYMVGPSDAEAAAQVQLMEDLIERGVDAIAIVPNDAAAMQPAVEKAQEEEIVVLSHENVFEDEMVDYNLETINQDVYSRNPVDALVRWLEETGRMDDYDEDNPAGIVHLVGSLEVPLHNYWADTANEYMEEEYPFIQPITDRLPTAESVEDSRSAALDLIRTYDDDLVGIIGWGSLGPIGAAQAVQEQGLEEDLWVGGSAIPSTAVSYLDNGSLKWAQLWDPADAGYALVYIAAQMAQGEEITEGMEIPDLGEVFQEGNTLYVEAEVEMPDAETAEGFGF